MVRIHSGVPKLLRGGRSLVSRQPHKLKVAGSNPAPATRIFRCSQVVRQGTVNACIVGSIPTSGAEFADVAQC